MLIMKQDELQTMDCKATHAAKTLVSFIYNTCNSTNI